MNDPHVQGLRYKAIPASFIDLVEGSSVEVETPHFRASLADGELNLEMRTHFASEVEARRLADPFVDGWAIVSEKNGVKKMGSSLLLTLAQN